MTGGMARTKSPREYARDEHRWLDEGIREFRAAKVVRMTATRLDAIFVERGLSARQFATEIGFPRQTIGGLVNGERGPDVVTICRLEDAFGVELWPRRGKASGFGHERTPIG